MAADIRGTSVSSIQMHSALQFSLLISNCLFKLLYLDIKDMDNIGIYNLYPAGGYRSHGQFLPTGHSKLANHQDVEREHQGAGNLEANWYTAPWQGKHKNTVTTRKLTQPRTQLLTGIGSILEQHFVAPSLLSQFDATRPVWFSEVTLNS
jgi:hypothetical protein